MNKKLLLLLCLACVITAVQAQDVEVQAIQKIKVEGTAYHPVFIENGKSLIITAQNYAGLVKVNIATGASEVITRDEGAGYGLRIVPESGEISYQTYKMDNNRKKIMMKGYNLAKKAETSALTQEIKPYVSGENLKIVVNVDGNKTVLTPNGSDCRYLWPALSPDGSKIVYTVSGRGSYVCAADGTNPVKIGTVRAAKWIDNDWIVGMDDADNGSDVTSSAIVVAKADGTYRKAVTSGEMKAMYPAAYGSKIAFNTCDGELYIMEITINK